MFGARQFNKRGKWCGRISAKTEFNSARRLFNDLSEYRIIFCITHTKNTVTHTHGHTHKHIHTRVCVYVCMITHQ